MVLSGKALERFMPEVVVVEFILVVLALLVQAVQVVAEQAHLLEMAQLVQQTPAVEVVEQGGLVDSHLDQVVLA
jgi:hypothetical protein